MRPIGFQPKSQLKSTTAVSSGSVKIAPKESPKKDAGSSPVVTESVPLTAPAPAKEAPPTTALAPVEAKRAAEPVRPEAAPTTLTQMEETAPAQAMGEVGPPTDTQLVAKALESYGKAEGHFDAATGAMGSLPEKELQTAKESVTYSVASMMGEMTTKGEDGKERPMYSGEIKNEVSKWPEDKQTAFKARVREFATENPDTAKIGMASGAAEWGQDKWLALDADEKAGKPVDQELKTTAAMMYINGTGYSTETNNFADSVNGLIKNGRQDLAQGVIDATVNS